MEEVGEMSDTRFGEMASDIEEVTRGEGEDFVVTVRLADGRSLRTVGRIVVTTDNIKGFHFDSEEFQREMMKGNIDIRAVSAKLGRILGLA